MQLQHTKSCGFNLVNQTSFLVIWKALLGFVIIKEGGCISSMFASVFLPVTSFIPACKSYKAQMCSYLVRCLQLEHATFVYAKMLNLALKPFQPTLQAFTLIKTW